MPCTYDPSPDEVRTANDQLRKKLSERDEFKKELDRATRLLCELTKNFELYDKTDFYTLHVRGLKTWIKDHKKMDKAREAAKASKK